MNFLPDIPPHLLTLAQLVSGIILVLALIKIFVQRQAVRALRAAELAQLASGMPVNPLIGVIQSRMTLGAWCGFFLAGVSILLLHSSYPWLGVLTSVAALAATLYSLFGTLLSSLISSTLSVAALAALGYLFQRFSA